MKKFALSLIIASAAVFGMGAAASAQYLPPTTPTTTTTTTTTTVAPTTTTAATTTSSVPDSGDSGANVPTVPGGGLPATGSSGMGTTTGIAIGLLVVGLGLFVVTRVRKSQPNAA